MNKDSGNSVGKTRCKFATYISTFVIFVLCFVLGCLFISPHFWHRVELTFSSKSGSAKRIVQCHLSHCDDQRIRTYGKYMITQSEENILRMTPAIWETVAQVYAEFDGGPTCAARQLIRIVILADDNHSYNALRKILKQSVKRYKRTSLLGSISELQGASNVPRDLLLDILSLVDSTSDHSDRVIYLHSLETLLDRRFLSDGITRDNVNNALQKCMEWIREHIDNLVWDGYRFTNAKKIE